jgi:UDP-glucose:glycoprotein glucosyltransferase
VLIAAGGHLTENLAMMTMSSVIRRASVPVEFWILARFETPSFAADAAKLAAGSNCPCHVVRYEWPHWVESLPERARATSLSRLLFLDLMLPLDVERVISFEPGMVLRGDVAELLRLDMGGAPCAFVPFPRAETKEMNSTVFWGRGFWRNLNLSRHYRGAVFVVDLPRWRHFGVGELVRENMNGWAVDYHMCADLEDQVVSYVQVHVNVFPLPEEWGWCWGWYDEGTEKGAKAVGACRSGPNGEKSFTFLMNNVSIWRKFQDKLTRFHLGEKTKQPVGKKS